MDIYAERSYKWERKLDVMLAVTSSASIAGWTIWNRYSYIWGFIIAISQVISAIKPILPFSKRMDMISKVLPPIVDIFNKMEKDWFDIANGNLTEKEINDLLYKYKSTYSAVEREILKSPILLNNEEVLNKADELTNDYFVDF